jgi:hypothetical protein
MKSKAKIRYISGREEFFEIELQGPSGTAFRLNEFVKDPNIILRDGKELIVIPGSAIECITLTLPDSNELRVELRDVQQAKRLRQ